MKLPPDIGRTPCRLDPDQWYSTDLRDLREAADACQFCPVRQQCLDLAVANGERAGVWGGQIFAPVKTTDPKPVRCRRGLHMIPAEQIATLGHRQCQECRHAARRRYEDARRRPAAAPRRREATPHRSEAAARRREVCAAVKNGASVDGVALMFGITTQTVRRIVNRQRAEELQEQQ